MSSKRKNKLNGFIGPLSFKSEYRTLQLNDLTKGSTKGSFSGNAGYVSLGWFINGENEPWRNGLPAAVTPKRLFVFGKGGTGAFQVLSRYDWLEWISDCWKRVLWIRPNIPIRPPVMPLV